MATNHRPSRLANLVVRKGEPFMTRVVVLQQCWCSHDAEDVTGRETVATNGSTNDVEQVVAQLVNIVLFKELNFTLRNRKRLV